MELKSKGISASAVVAALAITALVSTVVYGYIQDPNTALMQGFTPVGGDVRTDDALIHLGGSDGSDWFRLRTNSSGVIITSDGGGSINIDQQALSTTSAAVPASALASRFQLEVFNEDTAINIFCEDGTATATTGAMIEPRTGRTFKTTEAIQCIAASGTPRIDYTELGP